MVALTNFYENLKEANMRLRGTIVLYDNIPCYVHGITNHKDDGIFRVYCEPIGNPQGMSLQNAPESIPFSLIPFESADCGKAMDLWLEKYPQYGIMRKHMNSPAFNKFRPFPLGMINWKGRVYHLERQPVRQTFQGLSANMLSAYVINSRPEKTSAGGVSITSDMFRDMIMGVYPSKEEVLQKFEDENVTNEAIAFHRLCAIVKGPVGTRFLAYKNDVVGFLPNKDFTCLLLDKKFKFLKEAIDDLKIFDNPCIC